MGNIFIRQTGSSSFRKTSGGFCAWGELCLLKSQWSSSYRNCFG